MLFPFVSVKSSALVGVAEGTQLPAVFQSLLVAPVQVRAVANSELAPVKSKTIPRGMLQVLARPAALYFDVTSDLQLRREFTRHSFHENAFAKGCYEGYRLLCEPSVVRKLRTTCTSDFSFSELSSDSLWLPKGFLTIGLLF